MSPVGTTERPRVCFLFIGHHHQILHAAPVAALMARNPAVEVHVAASTETHLQRVRTYAGAMNGGPMRFHKLWPDALACLSSGRLPPKVLTLASALPRLAGFDAIVTPERTSLLLRRMGLKRPLFIHTDHGAGDRAVGYEQRIAEFDFTLLAGEKQRARMAAQRLLRDGSHAVVGYPKFDLADALDQDRGPLFEQDRPVVLFNPHFRRGLGSWPRFGWAVLEQFAEQGDYNLIFAPHVRLFETASPRERDRLQALGRLPHVHVDLGGPRACDMTYTNAADVYLGDVSSQVYEFLRRPRPCLFLNAHGVDWLDDENYRHWRYGPVRETADDLISALDAARAGHAAYAPVQAAGFAETFDLQGASSERAASAILSFLAARRPCRQGPRPAPAWLPEPIATSAPPLQEA